ncbi:hypothetical protein AGABI1DRAFT_111019 [Agaricus bisporus var. burnettii JB137-S8]|uniref:Uncharacterized protein n=1 Tax=Agaricus bisporus var. burnettii (strain JB137-S8 / ATCC MYA-4627 / FGSC 10392) TaxID=597362 RepID=K5Y372_AGABU|nr:uncharacterized protein AGABI1DRAFT_111019 [Agaricus bisporus var. burnettii JB137-S8]EKM82375.1 hypothetical protein AGABI1DRAFT_111019 [Agaricus bisporus var. burnettii JB137-S8]
MSDACASNSGVHSVTGTEDMNAEAVPTTTPSFEGRVEMPHPGGRPIEIDETCEAPEDIENLQQYEEVRSSEAANNAMPGPMPTLRSSSSSSASSSTSSTSSSSTTPSSVSVALSKTCDTSSAFNHPGLVVEQAASEEHMLASSIGQQNDATTMSSTTNLDCLKGTETDIAPTSPSSSTSSLPQVICRVPTSTSVINVPDGGHDQESYGLLSLLRPRTPTQHNLTVRFAPLPELAPRKRKSSVPLGMAARTQLTRRRRMYQGNYDDRDPYQPRVYVHAAYRSEEGNDVADSAELRMLKKKVLDKLRKEEEEGLEEDSLVVLAKKMGSAGKHLWKKMLTQKVTREDLNSLNEQRAGSLGENAERTLSKTEGPVISPPQVEKDEEKVDHFDEKAPIWNKLQKASFHNLHSPTLSTT